MLFLDYLLTKPREEYRGIIGIWLPKKWLMEGLLIVDIGNFWGRSWHITFQPPIVQSVK